MITLKNYLNTGKQLQIPFISKYQNYNFIAGAGERQHHIGQQVQAAAGKLRAADVRVQRPAVRAGQLREEQPAAGRQHGSDAAGKRQGDPGGQDAQDGAGEAARWKREAGKEGAGFREASGAGAGRERAPEGAAGGRGRRGRVERRTWRLEAGERELEGAAQQDAGEAGQGTGRTGAAGSGEQGGTQGGEDGSGQREGKFAAEVFGIGKGEIFAR